MISSAPEPDPVVNDSSTSTSNRAVATSQPAATDLPSMYTYQMAQMAAYQAWQAQLAAAQRQQLPSCGAGDAVAGKSKISASNHACRKPNKNFVYISRYTQMLTLC